VRLRYPTPKRNLRPSLIHSHRPVLFEQIETITAPSPLFSGAGDKVQVMRPIRAMQTAGHNSPWYRQHRSRPCKKTQGRGTHCLETGNGEESEAWATRPILMHDASGYLIMRKWHKVLLVILVLWLVFMVVMSPRLIEASHQKKAVDHVFYEYTRALLDQRWNDAYTFSSEDFRLRTSPQAFVNQHQELIQRFGKLQSVKQGHTVVEGKGTPSVWVAEIHAEFRFDTKAIGLVYWFRPTDGDWKLVGYRVEE
jgi:hypothetical protein